MVEHRTAHSWWTGRMKLQPPSADWQQRRQLLREDIATPSSTQMHDQHAQPTPVPIVVDVITRQAAERSPSPMIGTPTSRNLDQETSGSSPVGVLDLCNVSNLSTEGLGHVFQQVLRFADFFDRNPQIVGGENVVTPEIRLVLRTMQMPPGYLAVRPNSTPAEDTQCSEE